MEYTEIPTDLLVKVHELTAVIRDQIQLRDPWNDVDKGAVTLTFSTKYVESFEPLVKWLDYIAAVRAQKALHPNPD
ncbi:hypothetical protein [Mycobacteroides abscessus]|uniref:hypothetical protein n=1 Tax=Mycobacteroides abscessus TaxID=36809 RepID=UPI000C25E1FB|nr:hypothetical protein [Mycobacteroides abscessus]